MSTGKYSPTFRSIVASSSSIQEEWTCTVDYEDVGAVFFRKMVNCLPTDAG
jgi:hypothetical protein